jgi:hypothetical protein
MFDKKYFKRRKYCLIISKNRIACCTKKKLICALSDRKRMTVIFRTSATNSLVACHNRSTTFLKQPLRSNIRSWFSSLSYCHTAGPGGSCSCRYGILCGPRAKVILTYPKIRSIHTAFSIVMSIYVVLSLDTRFITFIPSNFYYSL